MKNNFSIKCRVCCSNDFNILFHAKNYEIKSSLDIKYFLCKKCKTIFLEKIPVDINEYYLNNYHPFNIDHSLSFKDKKNIKFIKKLKPNFSILEIGVGNGNFLSKLYDLGHKCFCIEPYASDTTNKLKNKNIKIISKTLENISDEDLNFEVDIIYSWHSIEHLRYFSSFLKICKKVINKGGYVIIGTPNPESLSFKYYRENWYHLQPPLHSYLINSKEIERQFSEIGFKKIKFCSYDIISMIASKYGWETSGYLLRKKTGKKIYSFIGKFLSFFMPLIEAILNRSSQYTIVFKK
ncbi:class I SAM-dependent methyltransferase [Candidatus Pelagibacter sp.]|uniref:class I SAM-dependent methyltransferase n=1 Tax=Candidatus Pelagibacter sp. TaxID=2024849 RepID=UPI003F875719